MRLRYSYPRHRCPALAPSVEFPAPMAPPKAEPLVLTPAHQKVLDSLRRGARVLLDLSKGRAMVYRMQQGMEQVMGLTVRTLSWLVQQGLLVISQRHGQWVHYTYVNG